MNTLLNALHVVAAVLLTGPLVVAPFAARLAITRRNREGVRLAANAMAVLGAGILLVAGLGVATLLTSDDWTPTTPWVLISATLFVVALGLTWGYAVPALRSAATMVNAEVTAGAAAAQVEEPPAPEESGLELAPLAEESAEDVRRRYRLDSIAARVTGAGWLLLLTFAAIAVLMSVRPFG